MLLMLTPIHQIQMMIVLMLTLIHLIQMIMVRIVAPLVTTLHLIILQTRESSGTKPTLWVSFYFFLREYVFEDFSSINLLFFTFTKDMADGISFDDLAWSGRAKALGQRGGQGKNETRGFRLSYRKGCSIGCRCNTTTALMQSRLVAPSAWLRLGRVCPLSSGRLFQLLPPNKHKVLGLW